MITCSNCKKEAFSHSGSLCITCYKKLKWKPKEIICNKCNKKRNHHSKGMCKNCANKFLYYDSIKKHNYRKWHNLDLEVYRRITKKCVICGFDAIVDLHHLDGDHANNSESNLIGLCPNHHKMAHMDEFKDEIRKSIEEYKNGRKRSK